MAAGDRRERALERLQVRLHAQDLERERKHSAVCFSCEEGQIPEPVRPEAANLYRQLGADLNVRVVLLLPIEELLVTGEMEATVRILDLIEAYPVLPGEFGRELFQNGEGTVAEMGSSACSDV